MILYTFFSNQLSPTSGHSQTKHDVSFVGNIRVIRIYLKCPLKTVTLALKHIVVDIYNLLVFFREFGYSEGMRLRIYDICTTSPRLHIKKVRKFSFTYR